MKTNKTKNNNTKTTPPPKEEYVPPITKEQFQELFEEYTDLLSKVREKKFEKNEDLVNAEDDVNRYFSNLLVEKGILTQKAKKAGDAYYCDRNRVYKKMYGFIRSAFGRSEHFKIIDPDTKETIKDNATLDDYAPNNTSVAKYSSGTKYPFIVNLPGVKKFKRHVYKVLYKYKGDHRKALDCLRFSVSGKFLESINEIQRKAESVDSITINPKKIKDKFYGNNLGKLYKAKEDAWEKDSERYRNFRNKVIYVELEGGIVIEMQLKLHSFNRVDDLTYKKYKISRTKNDTATKLMIERDTLKMYRWTIEKHNQNEVLQELTEIEAECDALGLQKNEDGFYPECLQFLENNYLVRPTQVLNLDNPLPNLSEDDKKLFGLDELPEDDYLHGLLADASPKIIETNNRYQKYIIPKFKAAHRGRDLRSNDKKMQSTATTNYAITSHIIANKEMGRK